MQLDKEKEKQNTTLTFREPETLVEGYSYKVMCAKLNLGEGQICVLSFPIK